MGIIPAEAGNKKYITMNVPEIVKQIQNYKYLIDIDLIICLAGIFLFGGWLLKTSFGSKSLSDSPPRRNNMPLYLPFVPLFFWLGIASLATSITDNFFSDCLPWQMAFLDNLTLCISEIITMIVIILLVRASFVRRLKGFGLNVKTIHKDVFSAFLNLLSIWPLLLLMIIITIIIGKLIWGQDFEIQTHQELELISAYPQLPVRVLTIVTAVLVVPVFEEMLFRGMFQTMIRSIVEDSRLCERLRNRNLKVWLSILISSGLFAVAHYDPGHWPPLFALSLAMGYAYEKSGSLFRPIFIHIIFNATSVIAVLYQ